MDQADDVMRVSGSKQFLSLLMRNQIRIHTYILYRIPNRNDAEDILQDTIVVMLDKFSEYKEETNFFAWGITIARHKIMSFKQKNKTSKLIFDDSIIELVEKETSLDFDSFQEDAEALRSCVGKLSPKYKTYLRLRYEQGLTYREIGKQIAVSMQAVYKTMVRIHVFLLNCVRPNSHEDVKA
jgi:RNA polymerase sigma-70 factor (ECF subfamily)